MEVLEMVQSLGFPVVCVCACWVYITNDAKNEREDNLKREERMFNQLDRFADTIESLNNTLITIDSRLTNVEHELLSRKEVKCDEQKEK